MYGQGISKMGELIDLGTKAGIVEKSGSWYSYDSTRIGQGRENAKQFLRDNPEMAAKIEHAVRANAGIDLRREYSVRRDGDWRLLESPMRVRRGELVRVDLYASLPTARHFVVIDDPVPGGLEPVNRDLATASTVDADEGAYDAAGGSWWHQFDDWRGYGRSWWSFYHQELRHDAARFYSDYLPGGNYHLSYVAQAIATGEFTVLPLRAEEMYDPDVYGRGMPAALEVGEAAP